MKKCGIMLLILCAVLSVWFSANAEGNRLLEAEGDQYFSQLLWDGETLYAPGRESLYTWKPGDEALTPWKDTVSLPAPKGIEKASYFRMSFDDVRFFLDDGRLRGAKLLQNDDGETTFMQFCDITFEGGEVRATGVQSVKLPKALREAGIQDLIDMCALDGALYMVFYDFEAGTSLCVVDHDNTGAVSVEGLDADMSECSLIPTSGGVLLAQNDYQGLCTTLSRVDRNGGRSALCALPRLECCTVAGATDCAEVYAVLEGKVCPVDLETGTLGEAVSATPLPPTCAALIDGGRCYVAVVDEKLLALDTTRQLEEGGVLTIRGICNDPGMRDDILRFAAEHPGMTPVLVYDGVGPEVLDGMLTRSADTDIYLLESMYNSPYEALLERGYMLPLDGSEAITGLIARMYPGVREKLCRDGIPCAIPIWLSGYGLGVSETALRQLGFELSDVPEDWAGFLDFLENDIKPRLGRLGSGAQFTYDEVSQSEFREQLRNGILNGWVYASQAAGIQIPDYEDARLVALLERVEDMDLSGFGLDEDQESASTDEWVWGGYSWGGGTDYLIQLNADYLFPEYTEDFEGTPLVLGFGDDRPGAIALSMCAAFVNPYSVHSEAAVELMEMFAESRGQTLLYALCPDLTEPLRRPEESETIAYYEKQIQKLRADLDAAEPADRQMLEADLQAWLDDYAQYRESGVWLITPQRLEWYRSHDNHVIIASPTWFEKDGTGEAWELMKQYASRQLTVREFISAVNQKARMMALEG